MRSRRLRRQREYLVASGGYALGYALNVHPHVDALVAERVFLPDGSFERL